MFLPDYNLNITLYDEEGEEYRYTGCACFRPLRDFNKDVSKMKVELDPKNSKYTTEINSNSFGILKRWLEINAIYSNHKCFTINEGTHPAKYYFNLGVYFRLSFEWLYMPTLFTYQAVFGKEFDQQKLVITQAFQNYVGLRTGNHGITDGTIYLQDKLKVDELKERFRTKGVWDSWQECKGDVFQFSDAYTKHGTLIGVYEQFIEDLHSK